MGISIPTNLLIHTIKIYTFTESVDGYGNVIKQLSSDYITKQARVVKLGFSEFQSEFGIYKQGSIAVYLNDASDVNIGDIIEYNSQKYKIVEIIDVYDFSLSHYIILAEPYV